MTSRCIIYYLPYKTISSTLEALDILHVLKVKRIKPATDGISNTLHLAKKKNLCNYADLFPILDLAGRWIITTLPIVRKLGVYATVTLSCTAIFTVVLSNTLWKL